MGDFIRVCLERVLSGGGLSSLGSLKNTLSDSGCFN